jgi:hypothetical protein
MLVSAVRVVVLTFLIPLFLGESTCAAETLMAGIAKADITHYDAGPVNDPLFAKVLVLGNGDTRLVLITLDVVAVGEIGPITHEFLPTVRGAIQTELGIPPSNVIVNASHCHGIARGDSAQLTIQAVREAVANLVPVKVGVGHGHEDRVSENRRLKLKSGREADVRHAYSLPPDEEIAEVGPIDPEIGVVRFDRLDGSTLAVVYNFACHPIQGAPSGGNTADMIAFSSEVIESAYGPNCLALFVQGCGGDINPVRYKIVSEPRDAEPLGHRLGLSALKAAQAITPKETTDLVVLNETLPLPRSDNAEKIAYLEDEVKRLTATLRGTTLNARTFLELVTKYGLFDNFPTYYSHRYLQEDAIGVDFLKKLDAANRQHVIAYLNNLHTMEEITRIQTNLALLRKHQAENIAAGSRTIDVELSAIKIGDFRLLTFPGELTVRIGLGLKKAAPHDDTFIAGYTNGYIYYAPTTEQLLNVGYAQEDSDCVLAPEWQGVFETRALEMLRKLD